MPGDVEAPLHMDAIQNTKQGFSYTSMGIAEHLVLLQHYRDAYAHRDTHVHTHTVRQLEYAIQVALDHGASHNGIFSLY